MLPEGAARAADTGKLTIDAAQVSAARVRLQRISPAARQRSTAAASAMMVMLWAATSRGRSNSPHLARSALQRAHS